MAGSCAGTGPGSVAATRERGRLSGWAGCSTVLGEIERAEDLVTEGVTILRVSGDALMLAMALILQGVIANYRGAYDRAERCLRRRSSRRRRSRTRSPPRP